MATLRLALPTRRRNRSQLPTHTNESSHNDASDELPLHEFHPKPSSPEHRSLLVPASDRRRHITQYLRALVRSNEERLAWAPGVWARLPVSSLAALIGVLLRTSDLFIPFFVPTSDQCLWENESGLRSDPIDSHRSVCWRAQV